MKLEIGNEPNLISELSVSSNGSTWVKQQGQARRGFPKTAPFSILERIDVGETGAGAGDYRARSGAFSILERIDVGETQSCARGAGRRSRPFSILERIDVGETPPLAGDMLMPDKPFSILERIDVGETSCPVAPAMASSSRFQYPRTDRRG